MSEPSLQVFQVFKTLGLGWTIVAAESTEDAERIAAKLPDEAFDEYPELFAVPIHSRTDLPEKWGGDSPYTDPDDKDLREYSFDHYFPCIPPIDEREQHAFHELVLGSIVLRPPYSNSVRAVFERLGVYETSEGIFFTTLTPLPDELRPYAVCHASPLRPAAIEDYRISPSETMVV